MKKVLIITMLALSIQNYAQVAITSSYRGANDKFKKGELEKFKGTTTVFVLPELNKKEDYEKILKDVWTVTPFKVVDYKDFNMLDYDDGKYSIAKLIGDITVSGKGTVYVHTNFTIRILDKEKFDKRFAKLKSDDKKYNKKLNELFNENLSYIARVPLSASSEFLRNAMVAGSEKSLSDLYHRMYSENSFTNTSLGMLKNYFQLINQMISKGKNCGLYDDFTKPEIKNLKDAVLYIPEAYMIEYNPWSITEQFRNEKDLKQLLEDYKYKFQFIKDEDLEKKISNNEDIYYLRYVSMNANKYLDVVSAKTGNPVYYFYGILTYKLKNDDFKKISKAIEAK